jgi:hypothetical protein
LEGFVIATVRAGWIGAGGQVKQAVKQYELLIGDVAIITNDYCWEVP